MGNVNRKLPMAFAYTMIELVMVISIIAILAVSAVPKFLNTISFSGSAYYKDVLASIRYAQKAAVGMGCDVQVNFTGSTITLNTRSSCTSGSFTQAIKDPALGGSTYVRTAPSGTNISSATFPIYFNSLGQAKNSGTNNVSNATITVGSTIINVVGETGYTY